MKGMLKAEFFKFRHTYVLWIILAVISSACMISVATGTYCSAEQTLNAVAKDSMVPILACVLYSAVLLTEDFSSGIIRHYIASGYKRREIVFAKFLHYISGSSLLLFLYPGICVCAAAVMQGLETSFASVMENMLLLFVGTLPLYWGIFGLFFLISMATQKGVLAMGISLAVSILGVVFTKKFYGSGTEILKYSPVIQINEIASGTITGAYGISVLLSLAMLAVCAGISMMRFCRTEL